MYNNFASDDFESSSHSWVILVPAHRVVHPSLSHVVLESTVLKLCVEPRVDGHGIEQVLEGAALERYAARELVVWDTVGVVRFP